MRFRTPTRRIRTSGQAACLLGLSVTGIAGCSGWQSTVVGLAEDAAGRFYLAVEVQYMQEGASPPPSVSVVAEESPTLIGLGPDMTIRPEWASLAIGSDGQLVLVGTRAGSELRVLRFDGKAWQDIVPAGGRPSAEAQDVMPARGGPSAESGPAESQRVALWWTATAQHSVFRGDDGAVYLLSVRDGRAAAFALEAPGGARLLSFDSPLAVADVAAESAWGLRVMLGEDERRGASGSAAAADAGLLRTAKRCWRARPACIATHCRWALEDTQAASCTLLGAQSQASVTTTEPPSHDWPRPKHLELAIPGRAVTTLSKDVEKVKVVARPRGGLVVAYDDADGHDHRLTLTAVDKQGSVLTTELDGDYHTNVQLTVVAAPDGSETAHVFFGQYVSPNLIHARVDLRTGDVTRWRIRITPPERIWPLRFRPHDQSEAPYESAARSRRPGRTKAGPAP
jgi:hypothetical protein